MVDLMERDSSGLHRRMDEDFELYRLAPYQGHENENGVSLLDGYLKFTSNDPRTNMNLGIHLVTAAKKLVRVHQPRAQKEERGINNLKELFVLGCFNAVDERRSKLLMPPLVNAMATQALLRGRIVQRVLLVKEKLEREELEEQAEELFDQMGDQLLQPPPLDLGGLGMAPPPPPGMGPMAPPPMPDMGMMGGMPPPPPDMGMMGGPPPMGGMGPPPPPEMGMPPGMMGPPPPPMGMNGGPPPMGGMPPGMMAPPPPPPPDMAMLGAPPPGGVGMMPGMGPMPPPPSDTRTYVDIQDWDPRNTYWGMGKHGLAWACHKVRKTQTQIMEEYGVDVEDLPDTNDIDYEGDPRFTDSRELDFAIYDYFDDKVNMVILEQGRLLKPATPHGMGRVPVSIGIVGSLPFLQAEGDDYGVQYGESLYNSNRELFEQNNFMLSIMAEITHRAIKAPLNLRSRDGSFTLEGDPRVTGAETSTSTQNEEDIVPIPLVEMAKETGVYLQTVQGMMQRGIFPFIAFGNLDFQISGYMGQQLRQSMEVPIVPAVKSMSIGLTEIGNILCDAYTSGNFDPMELSGRLQDPQRTYFSEVIEPNMVKNAGNLEVEMVPQLPQDNTAQIQLARMLTEGQVPLVDMRFAREHYLQLQDVDQIERAVLEQMSVTASPVALAFKMMMAAAEQGDEQLAMIYQDEVFMQLIQKANELMRAQMEAQMGQQMQQQGMGMGGPGGPGGQGGGGRGLSADVMPQAPIGAPPPPPTPQQGPLVPPGQPRPGARGQSGGPPRPGGGLASPRPPGRRV
jgi:hypothetical protein